MKTVSPSLFKALALSFMLSSCSPDPMDQALDQYDAIITKWEKRKMEKALTYSDLTAIQQEFFNAKVDPQQLMKESDISNEQHQRAVELSQRVTRLMLPF